MSEPTDLAHPTIFVKGRRIRALFVRGALLDATGAYHRDVVRHSQPGVYVRTPMMQLQDPKQTKMLIVSLPETTSVLEAEALQADLRTDYR